MEYAVCKVDACIYCKLNENTPVFNINTIDSVLHVYLTPEYSTEFNVLKIEEILDESPNSKVEVSLEHEGEIVRVRSKWLDIDFSKLNTEPGQHVYKISMVHNSEDCRISLYFSYIIQNGCPDKPYVYMKRNCNLA